MRIGNNDVTLEPELLTTSRLIDNRQYKIKVELDGSIKDYLTKFDNVVSLDDELYKELANLQAQSQL